MKIKRALMYHDVYHQNVAESGFQNPGAIHYKVQSDIFEVQIRMIAEYCKKNQIKQDEIALTFDDGGESFYSIIAPILEKYHFKGYFFVTTSLIGTPRFMTKEQIIDLYHRGHHIGAHSHTHPKQLSALTPEEITHEWKTSIDILNQLLPENIKTASIPGGFFSKASQIALKQNKIEQIYTSKPSSKVEIEKDNLQIIGRFAIKSETKNESIQKIIGKNPWSRHANYIKWATLRILNSILGDSYYKIREYLLKKSASH